MNSKIDIDELIAKYNLNISELARFVFPDAKYPKHALNRIRKGEAVLDANQLSALATYIGVPVSELFSDNFWKGRTEDGCLVFLKGRYKAKLRYLGVFLSIYKDDKLCLQEIGDMAMMTIKEFTDYLDITIKSLENGND
jgi:hypothetical protein